MVNNYCSPIPKLEGNKKQYTTHDVKKYYRARQLQNITGQPVNLILYAVDNNILQNLSILREDVGMYEDIYGTSVPHFKSKQSATRYNMWNPL